MGEAGPASRPRVPLEAPALLNHTWALDFMGDTLYDGRCYRTLNVLDEGNREGLAIEIDTSLPSARVVQVLEQLVAMHGAPDPQRVHQPRSGQPDPGSRSTLVVNCVRTGPTSGGLVLPRFNGHLG